ncbi:MAG: Sun protein [Labilithrix sp.]|nr:Sun protein [Labilithrix sp.]MCW5818151.1 Sun protein [Labilithrix sp.]
MPAPPTARGVAATVLARVASDAAFAAAALDAELERAVQLEPRDRALATELVYGALRLLPWLEERVARHATRGLDAVEPLVRAHLVLAAYQVLVLTRVPAFAAVNEAVTAVRGLRGAKVAGFANAVLRKIAAEPRPSEEELARAALASVDPALRDAVVRAIGEEEARAIFLAGDAPPLGLRIEDASARDAWLARFREARPHATFEAGRASPHAIVARGAGKLAELPGAGTEAWTAQEEGSQVVALALGARAGDVVLDACAGRGNKTGLLARAVLPGGAVDAADLHPKKLERLARELERIGLAPRATFAVDWARGAGGATGPYDRILVDAPCSGTGTLRRRPELALRRALGDVAALAETQRAIVRRAATLLRPGGRLVYAVCSVLREEAEDVVADAPSLAPAPFDASIATGETTFRLLPSRHGTDGYFLASFVRT